MSADVVIMAVSALEGWTSEDTELLDRINCNKVKSQYCSRTLKMYMYICV